MKKEKYWYKLDNAGKIFPAVSKDDRSNVFRLSFYIDEIVDKDILELAVNKVLPRFETFAVQLKNGLFWNYFGANTHQFRVEEEPAVLCEYFKPVKNYGFLFKVYYLDNKITLETFHALTDGSGALAFLKSVTYHYFKLRGFKIEHENKILSEKPYSKKESEDNFISNYDKDKRRNLQEEKAYKLSGESFNHHWVMFVKAKVDTKQLIQVVKTKYKATITQYVTALLAYCIYKETVDFVSNKKPLKIFVPVNLRPYFDSVTLRNFSLYIKASYPSHRNDYTFENMLEMTKEQFVDQLDKDKLQSRISSLVGYEKNPIIRILPLVLKTIAFKIGYYVLGDSISSCSISNLGIVDLPKDMMEKISDVDFANSGYGLAMTLISMGSFTNIIMTSPLKDLSIINQMISLMVKEGIDVTIDTNYKEGYDEIL
ncbi:MAG: hypothetical protein A2013_06425 [Tenericutes bacterium GWE2_38_8]|nr:MAG: hypothetical protein A2013_06425 [Tenericutes bacterium GWE2_38_8]OHE41672.1 MAG: hypothetical protein A2102_04015 [Tenericutes bacterium GWF2_38_8]HCB66468.1 hypothetical protein [Acholeplasmataceae bacterium]